MGRVILSMVWPLLKWAITEWATKGGSPPLVLGKIPLNGEEVYVCLDIRKTPCQ